MTYAYTFLGALQVLKFSGFSHFEVTVRLLEAGAPLKLLDQYGRTPFDVGERSQSPAWHILRLHLDRVHNRNFLTKELRSYRQYRCVGANIDAFRSSRRVVRASDGIFVEKCSCSRVGPPFVPCIVDRVCSTWQTQALGTVAFPGYLVGSVCLRRWRRQE